MKNGIQLFEERKVRTVWDDKAEEWYFSIVDVVGILTDSPNPNNYWKVLKNRLKKEELQNGRSNYAAAFPLDPIHSVTKSRAV